MKPLMYPLGAVILSFILAGCVQFGWLAGGLIPQTIPAVYEIPPQPTLVLVDDPNSALGDPALTNVLAQQVEQLLLAYKAVPSLIQQQTLMEYRQKLGEQYVTTPVDQVGRDLGAAQVIHVTVQTSGLVQEPTLLRPTATATVKLIDVQNRIRLFPQPQPSDALAEREGESQGFPVSVRLRYRSMGQEAQSMLPLMRKALAVDLGTKIGQLFFERKRESKTGEWSDVESGAP